MRYFLFKDETNSEYGIFKFHKNTNREACGYFKYLNKNAAKWIRSWHTKDIIDANDANEITEEEAFTVLL